MQKQKTKHSLFKRITAGLIAFSMVLGCFPAVNFAATSGGTSSGTSTSSLYSGRIDNVFFLRDKLLNGKMYTAHIRWTAGYFEENSLDLEKQITSIKLYLSSSDTFAEADTVSKEVLEDCKDFSEVGCNIYTDLSGIITQDKYPGNTKLYAKVVVTYKNSRDVVLTAEGRSSKTYSVPLTGDAVFSTSDEDPELALYPYQLGQTKSGGMEAKFSHRGITTFSGEVTKSDVTFESYASAGSNFNSLKSVKLDDNSTIDGYIGGTNGTLLSSWVNFYDLEELGITNRSPMTIRFYLKWNGGESYCDFPFECAWQYGENGKGNYGETTSTRTSFGQEYKYHEGHYYQGIEAPPSSISDYFYDPFSAGGLQVEKRDDGYYVTCSATNEEGENLPNGNNDKEEWSSSAMLLLADLPGKDMFDESVPVNVRGLISPIMGGDAADRVEVYSNTEANTKLKLEAGPYDEGETYSFAVYTRCDAKKDYDKYNENWEQWNGIYLFKPKSVLSVTFGGTCNHELEKSTKSTSNECVLRCTKCGEYVNQEHSWGAGDINDCSDSVCIRKCKICGFEEETTHRFGDDHICGLCGWEQKTLTNIYESGTPTLTENGILNIYWVHTTTGISYGSKKELYCAEYGGAVPISVKVEANKGSAYREKDAVLLATTANLTSISQYNGVITNADVSGAAFDSLNYKEGDRLTFKVTETLWAGQQNTVSYTQTIGEECKHESVTKKYDDKNHWEECDNCGDILNEEPHNCKPDLSKCTETICAGSCDCGYTETHDMHSRANIDNNDGTHFLGCEYCGYRFDKDEPHDMMYISNNDYTHYARCSKCSYKEDTQNCDTEYVCNNNKTHSEVCKYCKYTPITYDCTYTNNYESDGAGHHYMVCDVCKGRDESSKTDCLKTYTYMGSHRHKVQCDDCFYIWGSGYFNCNEVRTDDDAGHHFECSDCHNKYDTNHIRTAAKKENYIAPNKTLKDGGYDMVVRCSICNIILESKHHDLVYVDPEEEKLKEKMKKVINSGAVPTNRGTTSSVTNAVSGMELDAQVEGIDELVEEEFADLISDIDIGEEDLQEYFGEDTQAEDVEIAVEPEVVVNVESYDRASNTLNVDISAYYSVVLYCGTQEKVLLEDEPMEVNNSLKLAVPLPEGFSRPGASINIRHNHKGEIHNYTGTVTEDGAYVEFTAEYGLSEFEFTANDVASVTYSYRTYTINSETGKREYSKKVYATKYFDDIQSAFTAAEDYSFEDEVKTNLPEGETYSTTYYNNVTLIADVTVDNALAVNGDGIALDLNGHTFKVTKTGSVAAEYIGIESKVVGTFTSEGTLNVNTLSTWTADNVNIYGGLTGKLSVDGGNVNITGGKFVGVDGGKSTYFNNGGDADINATISGNTEIDGMTFGIYADSKQHNIHLNVLGDVKIKNVYFRVMGEEKVEVPNLILNGGYYDVDPRTWLGGYVQVADEDVDNDNLDQYYIQNLYGNYVLRSTLEESEKGWYTKYYVYDENAFADYVQLGGAVEEYSNQTDWAADTGVYKYRVASNITLGDVNFDGEVTDADAALVLKYISTGAALNPDAVLNATAMVAADVDDKEGIDMLDVIKILEIAETKAS